MRRFYRETIVAREDERMSVRRQLALAALLCAACMSDPGLSPRSGAPSYGPTGAMPPTLSSAANDLAIPTWHWQRSRLPSGQQITAGAPDRYTLKFEGGGRLLVRADCNRGSAKYEVNGPSMKVAPVALTKMACEGGSQESEFVQGLSQVTDYAISGKELVLTLAGGGTMTFRAVP
jgi:heat shock protein HslJ